MDIYGASDDLIEVVGPPGSVTEEFNVLGMEDAWIATSSGLLASVQYDREGVWRFRVYEEGSPVVMHTEAPTDDDDNYSDNLHIDGDVTWVLLGPHMARVRPAVKDGAGA